MCTRRSPLAFQGEAMWCCTASSSAPSRGCCRAANSSRQRMSCQGGMRGRIGTRAAATASSSSAPGLCAALTKPCRRLVVHLCGMLHEDTHLEQLA